MASRAKCPVCLDDLQPPLAATLCGHVYCLSCLSASLASKNECPSCRANQLKLAKANKGKPVKLFLELPRISFEAGSVQAHLQEALDEEIAKTKKLEEELESRRARVNELERENRVHLTEINLLENTGKSQKKELANLKERYAEESRKRKRLEETRAAFEEELRRDLEIERSEFASQKEAHEQWHTHALKEKELGDRRLFKLEGQLKKMTKERDALAVKLASMESERTAPSISRPAPKLPSAVVLGDEFGIFDEPEKPRPKPQKEEKGDDVTLISDDSDLGVTMPGFNAFRSKLPAKKPDAGNAMPRKPLLPRNNINEPSLLKGEKRPYLDSLDGGKAKKKSVVDEQRGFMKSWMGGRT